MPAPLAIHSESPAGGAEVLLEVEALSKGFGGRPVLRGITFAVSRGSVFTLLGPSGAGKSVLLKCIAGVAQPDTGRIRFDGRLLDFSNRSVRNDFRQR
jgi:ABC-type multidrug transport system ATPase subunit